MITQVKVKQIGPGEWEWSVVCDRASIGGNAHSVGDALRYATDVVRSNTPAVATQGGQAVIIYVAGPYTGPSIAEIDMNVARAQAAGIEIMKRVHVALVPHTMIHHWDAGTGLTYEQFIAATMALLERCDAICTMGDWQSSQGAVGELRRAEQLGLTVYYCWLTVPEAN